MRIVIEQLTLPRTTKIKATKFDREGRLLGEFSGHFIEPKDYEGASKRLGVSEDLLRFALTQYRISEPKTYTQDIETRPSKPMFRVREENGTRLSAKVFTDFTEALKDASPTQVIEWDNTTWIVNLDIDFPRDAPTATQLMRFIETLNPSPEKYWQSRSGVGAHLIYHAENVFDADELAAIAAYNIQRRFPNCRCEFLSRTRAVPATSELFTQTQSANPDVLRTLLSTFSDVDIQAFLDSRGWVTGQRLPHSECPVNPSDKAKSNTPPVVIHADCVYCYVCNANGIRSGSSIAGRFPFAALSGRRVNTQISRCIEHFVHYGHARHVIRSKVDGENLARKVYSALLKLRYGDDARISAVFTAGEPYGLIRYQGYWTDNQGSLVEMTRTSPILKSLPHTQKVLGNGSVESVPIKIEWLAQAVDLSPVGYFPLVPIYGIQISQFQELPEDKLYSVQITPALLPEQHERVRPKYVPVPERIDMDTAWATLEAVFPGLCRELITCLIAARGCAEHRAGLPPMLFITGPTGTGKTTHIDIASAIVGDTNAKVYLNDERDRFMNQIVQSKRQSGFVNIDEVFKFGSQAKMKPIEAMESILSFTETSKVYIIHVGGVTFGHLPAFVFTDTDIPIEVRQHEQIARRVFEYKLYSTVEWERTLSESGINETKYLRTNGGEEMVSACDAILSEVIDSFFLTPATDFATVCEALGIKRLRDSVEMGERNDMILELFNAVCAAKDMTEPTDKHRFPKGSKVAVMHDTDKIYRAFMECQTTQERGSLECRMIKGADLMQVLKLKCPATLEIRKHGNKIGLRFIAVSDAKLVNGRLK